MEISDFTYDEKVGLSDFQMNEIYYNTFVLFGEFEMALAASTERPGIRGLTFLPSLSFACLTSA
jgi:hypothetical protein